MDEALTEIGLEPEVLTRILIGNYSAFDRQQLQNARAAILNSEYKSSLSTASGKLEKLLFLREYYNIDANLPSYMWLMELSLKLAEEHIPGFSPPMNLPGRPKTRDPISELKFLHRIEEIKHEKKCNSGKAIKLFLIQSGNKRPSSGEIKNFRNRLARAKNPKHNPLINLVVHPDTELQLKPLADFIKVFEN